MVICPSCGEQNFLSGDRCWACGKTMQPRDAAEEAGELDVVPEPADAPAAGPGETAAPAPEPGPVVPQPAPAALPEAPIPLAVLEARRRQAALDAMWQPQHAATEQTDDGPVPNAGRMPPGRPPKRFEEAPRLPWTAEEQQALLRAWLRKRVLWVVVAVVFVANVLEREPGLQFPLWLLVVILGAAYARARSRPR